MLKLTITKKNTFKVINEAVKVLNSGGIIIYPTETCYGVGIDPRNKSAVDKLLRYKRRPEGKAISIAVADFSMANDYVELNETAKGIYSKFLPGPITVISNSKHKVDIRLEAEDATLGVRIPAYKLVREIIKKAGYPITATSANSSGKKTPYSIDDILNNLTSKQKALIDLIIDAGELAHNPPSSVIDTTKQELKIIRSGSISIGEKLIYRKVGSNIEMQDLGQEIGLKYLDQIQQKALILMFNADLGAGKTEFIKGFAKAIGVIGIVNSPTFVIMKEYKQSMGKLIHLDAWRLDSIDELDKLELKQYIKKGNVIAVEWAGMARDYLYNLGTQDNLIKLYIEIKYIDLETREVEVYEE